MAKIEGFDEEGMKEWLLTRPQVIQDMAKLIPPGRLYRLHDGGRRVFPYSYNENGTLTVVVSGEYNLVVFERNVFGIKPEDLEECDLPGPEEEVGVVLTDNEDVDAFIEANRKDILAGKFRNPPTEENDGEK